MKKILALAVVLAVVTVLLPVPADAGGAAAAALGLASFAVFNQLVSGLFAPWTSVPAYYPAYHAAPVVYAAALPVRDYAPPPSYAPRATYTATDRAGLLGAGSLARGRRGVPGGQVRAAR
jgi:hypothetical protein